LQTLHVRGLKDRRTLREQGRSSGDVREVGDIASSYPKIFKKCEVGDIAKNHQKISEVGDIARLSSK
jgi:hypothetical protein